MIYEFKLPDIGEGLHEVEVVNWFVKPGDQIKENDNLVEVQTDKSVAEISSPVTGTIKQLGAELGEVIHVGEVLAVIDQGASSSPSQEPPPAKEKAEEEKTSAHIKKEENNKKGSKKKVVAAPSVRRLARELGIDISAVTPTGKGGKVTEDDVRAFNEQPKNQTEASAPAVPKSDEKRTGFEYVEEETREPIRGMRKAIFENMVKSKFTATHCTGLDEINVDRLVELRKQMLPYAERKGIKLTYLSFIVKAVTCVLKDHPIFNSSVDEEKMEIIYKNYIHIGIATATDAGLVVPIVRHADKKSILEIAAEIQDQSERARQRKLKSNELTGSTFTISSTGGKGGWYGTPIINYPEVAILGVHSIRKKPIVINDEIVIGKMMGSSFTFDHRIIDGEPVGRFMEQLKELLENPDLILLEGR